MNVEIGTESAQFLEKEHMYGIFEINLILQGPTNSRGQKHVNTARI
jgi:hypothetical protein